MADLEVKTQAESLNNFSDVEKATENSAEFGEEQLVHLRNLRADASKHEQKLSMEDRTRLRLMLAKANSKIPEKYVADKQATESLQKTLEVKPIDHVEAVVGATGREINDLPKKAAEGASLLKRLALPIATVVGGWAIFKWLGRRGRKAVSGVGSFMKTALLLGGGLIGLGYLSQAFGGKANAAERGSQAVTNQPEQLNTQLQNALNAKNQTEKEKVLQSLTQFAKTNPAFARELVGKKIFVENGANVVLHFNSAGTLTTVLKDVLSKATEESLKLLQAGGKKEEAINGLNEAAKKMPGFGVELAEKAKNGTFQLSGAKVKLSYNGSTNTFDFVGEEAVTKTLTQAKGLLGTTPDAATIAAINTALRGKPEASIVADTVVRENPTLTFKDGKKYRLEKQADNTLQPKEIVPGSAENPVDFKELTPRNLMGEPVYFKLDGKTHRVQFDGASHRISLDDMKFKMVAKGVQISEIVKIKKDVELEIYQANIQQIGAEKKLVIECGKSLAGKSLGKAQDVISAKDTEDILKNLLGPNHANESVTSDKKYTIRMEQA